MRDNVNLEAEYDWFEFTFFLQLQELRLLDYLPIVRMKKKLIHAFPKAISAE